MAPIHKRALGAYTKIYHITYYIDIRYNIMYLYMYDKINSRNKNNAFLKLIKVHLVKSLSKKVCL